MIVETCPKCGHDLVNTMLASNPPISKKECWSCGWSWTGEREEVIRVPFGGNGFDQIDVNSFSQLACDRCPNNRKNGGNGICNCTLGMIPITY